MTLDEQDLRRGLKFIVGVWEADFVVNAFSNDLAHIPAAEFKSDDGRDMTALRFEFFEDHTAAIGAGEGSFPGTWEQTDLFRYRLVPDALAAEPENGFIKAVESLEVQNGENLVFALGFLAIALRKTEDGHVTEAPDIGCAEPTEEDLAMKDIVGTYSVAKAMTMVGDDFGLFSREEAEAGGSGGDEAGMLGIFDTRVEFTDDHRVLTWSPMPAGVSEEDIKAAVESGEIAAAKDGFFCGKELEWKAVGGKYYYNTGEHRVVFDEEQSPWDELAPDGDGLIPFSSGMMLLKKEE
ncbi:MAG: hypothetical protein IKG85_07475 [Clostridia bacterium]|nr:hypothetical protein [Clostridia bacterium]